MTLKADIALDYLLNKISQEEFSQVFSEVVQRLPAAKWTTVVQRVVEEMRRRESPGAIRADSANMQEARMI